MSRDWERLYQRLDEIRARLEPGYRPPPAGVDKILRERARIMAQVSEPEVGGERLLVLEFLLAHERYAAEVHYIREVYPLRSLCPIPCTPPFILGVANIRGQLLSVVDIKRLFDLPEKGITNLNRILVVQSGATLWGLLADEVSGICEVPVQDLEPPLATLSGLQGGYIRGIFSRERLIVLDMEAMLSDGRLVVHEDV